MSQVLCVRNLSVRVHHLQKRRRFFFFFGFDVLFLFCFLCLTQFFPKVLEFQDLYLAALPNQARYEQSFMHAEHVTHVVVSASDFVVTASADGRVKFWKKKTVGIEFVKGCCVVKILFFFIFLFFCFSKFFVLMWVLFRA